MTEPTTRDARALGQCILFNGFSDSELERIGELFEECTAAPGTTIVREGDSAAEIFVIRDGAVDVVKRAPLGGGEQRLTTLRSGDTFGEMAFIDHEPRSATVRAVETTRLAVLPMEKLRAMARTEPRMETRMLRNLAADVARRLRGTSAETVRALEHELALERTRVAMGTFVTYVIGLMVGYGFLLRFVVDLARNATDTSLVSIPVIFGFAGILHAMARHSGEPMARYGLTLDGWRASIGDALRWTIPVLAAMTLAKWVSVHTLPALYGEPVFSFGQSPTATPEAARFAFFMSIAYVVVIPFQEFAARGALQGPLQRFLTGPSAVALAIIVANSLFVAAHLYLSPSFAITALVPGLFWGWLYARNQTLLGPIVSHVLIGWVGLYALGFSSLLT